MEPEELTDDELENAEISIENVLNLIRIENPELYEKIIAYWQ